MSRHKNKTIEVIKKRILKNVSKKIGDSSSKTVHIALLGTGGPMNNPKRIGAIGIGLITSNRFLLFDCGSGVWRNADIMGLPRDKLKNVFLTHFHSDHIADLGEVAFGSWAQGRSTPLEIYGPEGVQEVVEGYSRAYKHDFSYRTLHHSEEVMPSTAAVLIAKPFSLPPKDKADLPSELVEVYKDDLFTIHAWQADHGPVKPAVSYRIEVHGKRIAILGDTNYHAWMHQFCKDADIIVSNAISHESSHLLSEANAQLGFTRFAKMTYDITDYHMNPTQAATLANKANAKKLVLIHITPPIANSIAKRRYLKGIREKFSGPIVLGEDRMLLTID
jgi:ribonuclease Z